MSISVHIKTFTEKGRKIAAWIFFFFFYILCAKTLMSVCKFPVVSARAYLWQINSLIICMYAFVCMSARMCMCVSDYVHTVSFWCSFHDNRWCCLHKDCYRNVTFILIFREVLNPGSNVSWADTRTHVHTDTHVHIHMHTHKSVHRHTDTHEYIYIYIYIYIYMCVCVCV